MRNIDIEKKRPSAWPWLAGAAVLALIFWGVTVLLTPDEESGPQVQATTVEDTHPPAAIPEPPREPLSNAPPRALSEFAPLGEEDVGQAVRAEGEVVATGNGSFWLLAGSDVVRIDSDRQARSGDSIAVAGRIRPADPAQADRMRSGVLARKPGSEGWMVVRSLKIVENGDGGLAGGSEATTDA